MAIRRSYEQELNAPFRWPIAGDSPFVASHTRADNTIIEERSLTRMVLMISGYKKAADLMVKSTLSLHARAEREYLVFPILFNYRQFLELSLKYQLAAYGQFVGLDPNWKTHDLAVLWGEFIEMLERFGSDDPDQANIVVRNIVLEFAKIDPLSYSYRYPVDRKGNPIPIEHNELYLPCLSDVMEAVENYFSGCDGYLSSLSG